MKKTIFIEKPPPAFKINIPELAILYRKIAARPSKPEDVDIRLDVKIDNKSLTFTNLDEFREYEELPNTITNFSLHIYPNYDGRMASIRRRIFSNNLGVSACGESEA